jgi:hypothetical protein
MAHPVRPVRARMGKVAAAAVALTTMGVMAASPAHAGGRGAPGQQGNLPISVESTLIGHRVVGPGGLGAGDPDGTGGAFLAGAGAALCHLVRVADVGAVTGIELHRGDAGRNGPLIRDLTLHAVPGGSQGCDLVNPAIVAAVVASPSSYYVLIKTAGYLNGALRGNLSYAIQEGWLFATRMSGANEISPSGTTGVGDLDGLGVATVTITPTKLCFTLTVSGLDTPVAAHIHRGPAGVNGPVVVPLTAPGPDGTSGGCVTGVDPALLQDIAQNPANFYANVHTNVYPMGAVRGELASAFP